MKKYPMMTTEITYEFPNGEERDITVHYQYHRGEAQTHWHPGCDPEIEICDVTGDLTGIDVDSMIPAWEQKLMEDFDPRDF